MPNDPWKGIPDNIKAFRDGWEDITDHGRPYEVVLESDFSDDYWAARMCGTYEHIARSITAALQHSRIPSWNIPGDEMLGTEVRIARKTTPGTRPIYAVALREVFDRKECMKDLKFFHTNNYRPCTFVAIPRSEYISNLVLFSSTIASESRKIVEEKLLVAVDPLTIGQRCADWFLMKSMLLSGTMAGKIVGAVAGQDTTSNAQPSNQTQTYTLQECMQSWFGRHKSTAMMALGSRNENPMMRNLSATLNCVKALFEVGLPRWRRNPCIGVSPDGVVHLGSGGQRRAGPLLSGDQNQDSGIYYRSR
ncbi:hypothetical protein IV203_003710 [Nitzschia inconspicua]|uniref:Uncharacterized protein n=1 Tax=Nitzschia inconspicua TaxID=303405 RepID=A0A9K3L336_9STRA|nr:hypothetical protein IV203_003710 [Nitzschia inconspicua]